MLLGRDARTGKRFLLHLKHILFLITKNINPLIPKSLSISVLSNKGHILYLFYLKNQNLYIKKIK